MKSVVSLLGATSALALLAAASPALAEGTQSGATITNTVTVNYNVGGVAQTARTASDTFTVDRKVNLTIAEVGTTTTQVSPGQTAAITRFTVTNTSNDRLDIGLAVAQQTGGAGAHSNTDNFDVTNVRIYRDNNNDGLLDAGDTLVTYLDEVAADASVQLIVVSDIPNNRATGDVAAVTLTGTARAGGTSGTQGAVLAQSTGANTAGVDTVFADGAGATDAARDGQFSAKDDYTVLAAAITANKTSTVISDPQNGTSNPKAIPGAIVQYCIAVTNAPGGGSATNIVVTDPVPSDLAFVGGSIRLNGTVNGSGVCQADGSAGGSFAGNTVTAPLSDIAAGQTRTVVFQATVN